MTELIISGVLGWITNKGNALLIGLILTASVVSSQHAVFHGLNKSGNCPPQSPGEGVHVINASSIVWNWLAVSGADGYKYNTVNDSVTAVDNGTSLTFTQSGTSCNNSYNLFVWAYNSCGISSEKSLNASTFSPSIPTANTSSGVTENSFTSNWSPVSGASEYYIDIATDNSFTTFVSGYNNLNVGNVISQDINGLACSFTYYYRVRSGNVCGISGNSNTVSVTTPSCAAPNSWTQKSSLSGVARMDATGFSIGNKGYIGTGTNGTALKDFWEFDSGTNTWSQKADFGGTARSEAVGFSIGTKGYIGTGYDGGFIKDFWEYDPSSNSWVQKADFGGTARMGAVGFTIGTLGYLGTGFGTSNSYTKDIWEYDQNSDTWTRKADFGGVARRDAVAFAIGNNGYIGSGRNGIWYGNYKKDFWKYDQSTNVWVSISSSYHWMPLANSVGFSIGNKGYFGTGYNSDFGNQNFFYEYNPTTNSWSTKLVHGGGKVRGAVGFSINGLGYIGTGFTTGYRNVFWTYSP